MQSLPTIRVLREHVWSSLVQCVGQAAARDSVVAASEDALFRPLRLLECMAAPAAGALQDDPMSVERLRTLLYLAAPYRSLVEDVEPTSSSALDHRGEALFEASVIDHAGLLMLGLAACRVAHVAENLNFLRTLRGIALAAAPAEAIGRMYPCLPPADSMAIVLSTLFLVDAASAAAKTADLRPFASDPAEIGRRRCLSRVFEDLVPKYIGEAQRRCNGQDNPSIWDGATSVLVESVKPDGDDASPIAVVGAALGSKQASALGSQLQVVFCAPDQPPQAAKVISSVRVARRSGIVQIKVDVPRNAEPGWVGFSDDAQIEQSNRFRVALTEVLSSEIDDQPMLRRADISQLRVPEIGQRDPARPGKLLANALRRADNRWREPMTEHVARSVMGSVGVSVGLGSLARAQRIADSAVPMGPRIVSVRALQCGSESLLWLGSKIDVEVLIDPPLSGDSALSLVLDPAADGTEAVAHSQTLSKARHVFEIASDKLRDGLAITAVIASNGGKVAIDRKTIGPLAFARPRPLRVVLLRSQLVNPSARLAQHAQLASILTHIGAEFGVAVEALEFPWLDDDVAVVMSPITSSEDARVDGMLEVLSRRAILSPGLEDAVWLLLVPDGQTENPSVQRDVLRTAGSMENHRFFRAIPGVAARCLAVSNLGGLRDLFQHLGTDAEWEKARRAPALRLRLLGTYDGNELQLEPVVQQQRAAGPGGPFSSGINAIALDARGNQISATRLTSVRSSNRCQVSALLPVSPNVVVVELRQGEHILSRVARPNGQPRLGAAYLAARQATAREILHWVYAHTRNARPDMSLVLSRGDVATEVERFSACDHSPSPHWVRYASASHVILSACDGWNEVQCQVLQADRKEPATLCNGDPVRIRELGNGQFYADVASGWHVDWALDGQELGGEALIQLDTGESGRLCLLARKDSESEPLVDERFVEVS